MTSTGSELRKIEPVSGLAAMRSVSPDSPTSMGVSTPVGWTELTRMPWAASSLASVRMTPTIPCLEATYGARNGWPLSPATELMRTTEPPPDPIRWGMAATQVFHVPVRLIPITVSQTAAVSSSQRWTVQTPALATTMSSRPEQVDAGAHRGRQGFGIPHVDHGRDHAGPGLGHQPDGLVEVGRRGQRVGDRLEVAAQVDPDDVGALAGQPQGVAPALAAGRAGDQRHLSRHPARWRRRPGGHRTAPAAAGILVAVAPPPMAMARRRPSSTASSTPRGATQSPARSVPGLDR